MFGTDAVQLAEARFIHCQSNGFLGAWSETGRSLAWGCFAVDGKLKCGAQFAHVDLEVSENLSDNAFLFAEQSKQEMLSGDVPLVVSLGLLLGGLKHPSCGC